MKRSVVTHHWTAWWRSHRATSRWIAGSGRRRRSGRGGKRVARATPSPRSAPLAQLQPDQEAVGQHHGDRVPMEARPQPALVLSPAPLALGLFMTRFDRMPPRHQASQRFEGSIRGQVAPAILPRLGRPPAGSLPHQPAFVAIPSTRHPPTAYRDTRLAQPPVGALPPAHGAPGFGPRRADTPALSRDQCPSGVGDTYSTQTPSADPPSSSIVLSNRWSSVLGCCCPGLTHCAHVTE